MTSKAFTIAEIDVLQEGFQSFTTTIIPNKVRELQASLTVKLAALDAKLQKHTATIAHPNRRQRTDRAQLQANKEAIEKEQAQLTDFVTWFTDVCQKPDSVFSTPLSEKFQTLFKPWFDAAKENHRILRETFQTKDQEQGNPFSTLFDPDNENTDALVFPQTHFTNIDDIKNYVIACLQMQARLQTISLELAAANILHKAHQVTHQEKPTYISGKKHRENLQTVEEKATALRVVLYDDKNNIYKTPQAKHEFLLAMGRKLSEIHHMYVEPPKPAASYRAMLVNVSSMSLCTLMSATITAMVLSGKFSGFSIEKKYTLIALTATCALITAGLIKLLWHDHGQKIKTTTTSLKLQAEVFIMNHQKQPEKLWGERPLASGTPMQQQHLSRARSAPAPSAGSSRSPRAVPG